LNENINLLLTKWERYVKILQKVSMHKDEDSLSCIEVKLMFQGFTRGYISAESQKNCDSADFFKF